MSEIQRDVTRCLALVTLARQFPGITVAELARRAHVPEDQVREDLFSTLLMCGVPPYFPHDYVSCTLEGDRVTVHFADQFKRPISLTALEALSLKIALESLSLPGQGLPPAARRLLTKIENAMAPRQRASFRAMARRVAADMARQQAPAVVSRLQSAIDTRNEIEVDYFAPGREEAGRRRIEPLGLYSRWGRWYLAAHDVQKDRTMSLRVDRILSLIETDRRFRARSGFDLARYVEQESLPAAGEHAHARIRLLGHSARWMREIAEGGTLEETPDGVRWTTTFARPRAFASFLLGLGAEFVVEEPAELRDAVLDALRAAQRTHAASTRSSTQGMG